MISEHDIPPQGNELIVIPDFTKPIDVVMPVRTHARTRAHTLTHTDHNGEIRAG